MIKQGFLENQANIAYLSIGSNLGNKKKNLELAKIKLQNLNIDIIKISNNYETESWPNKKNPKFINIVLKIKTILTPINLMKSCQKIEKELGRIRIKKNEPRTCDIDIIDYGQRVIKSEKIFDLSIPHPKMHHRSFVLLPLYDLTKTWIHPIKKQNIKKLINSLDIKDLLSIKQI